MRSDLEGNKGRGLDIINARFGSERLKLSSDLVLPDEHLFLYFMDPNGADRAVNLPTLRRGDVVGIINIGAANSLNVQTPAGAAITTLSNVQGAIFVCSGQEWKFLTNTIGDALDPTEITSPDSSITVTIVGGTAITIVVDPANVDHNALLNYDANKHVDHTAVSVTAGIGLTGGGTIAATRTLSLDINGLTADTPALADSVAFYDASGADINKMTLTALNAILDHDVLVNFVANEHIDHSTVSVTAGVGLTGGGTIDATRTISLDITGQVDAALASTDEIIYYDVSGLDFNKRTFANVITDLSLLTSAAIGVSVQAYDAELAALAGLTSAADSAPYFTGSGTAALMTVTTFIRTLLDDTTQGAAKTTLGLGTGDSPQFATIELGAASDTTLSRSAAGTLAVEGVNVLTTATGAAQGKQTIYIPATAMSARTTNGAASGTVEKTTNKNMFKTMDFDTTTQEFVQFEVHMPKSWNLGTVTFQPDWSHAATATNFGVVWGLAGVALSDGDAGDVAFGTAQTSTDTGGTTDARYIGPESAAITIAGTPAAGDTVQFQLSRNPADGSDTLGIDARLHGIRLFFTTNASTDA